MKKQKIFSVTVGDSDCDNCEVCKLMAKAEKENREVTVKEFEEAVAKQNKINKIKGIGIYGI